ncbi:putative reverse transcriptase domain-containing protein [Tanacetum coccineum]
MQELREDAFFRNKNKDAHDHVDRILNIVSLFNILGVSQEAVLLNVSSNNTNGLAALVNKLDNLGRDMKKLKENVHAIQVGYQICEGPHLDKKCPLNEEVKQLEKVKYGEFRHSVPFNRSNGAKFYVGPPRTTNEAPSLSTGQCKVVNANHEMPNIPISSRASVNAMPRGIFEFLKLTNLRKTNMLIEVVDMTKKAPLRVVENILVGINKFLLPSDFVIINRTPNETIILGIPFLATTYAKIHVLNREISLGVGALDPDKDPKERSFDDYKWVFDLEIEQLADEYELGIGKNGHILDMIWENSYNWDDEELSSWGDQIIFLKAFIALAKDDPSMGKNDSRLRQWVNITMRKAINEHKKVNEASTKSDEHIHSGNEPDYLFYRELESADHEPLLSLPKFRGAEPKGESKGADQAIGNVQRSTFSNKTGEVHEKEILNKPSKKSPSQD